MYWANIMAAVDPVDLMLPAVYVSENVYFSSTVDSSVLELPAMNGVAINKGQAWKSNVL